MYARLSTLRDRMRSLRKLHADIDADIRDEHKRPLPDATRLRTLKRMRLQVKDHITWLGAHLRAIDTTGRVTAAGS